MQRALGARLNNPSYKDIPYASVLERRASLAFTGMSKITDISMLPVYDQGQLPICVAMADVKYAKRFLHFKNTGKLIEPSARFAYAVGHTYSNLKPYDEGSYPRDVARVTTKAGCPLIGAVPDDLKMTHAAFSVLDVTVPMIDSGLPYKNEGYAVVENTWDMIEQAILRDGFVTLTCDVGDWTYGAVRPPINGITSKGYHRVFIYGFDRFNKTLIGRNSWGEGWGYSGDFKLQYQEYQKFLFDILVYTDIPEDLLADARAKTTKPEYKWDRDMIYNQKGNADVKALQEVLRYEGFIPGSQPATGNYLDLTRKAVLEYQQRYGVSSLSVLLELNGFRVGSLTRNSLNKNFGRVWPVFPGRIKNWALAIKGMEGYFAPGESKDYPNGTPAWRNKNPGNLKAAPLVRSYPGFIGENNGFAVFSSYEAGLNALQSMLFRACTPPVETYSPEMTLYAFYEKYAPKSDNNDPKHYAEVVAKSLGVEPGLPIKFLII